MEEITIKNTPHWTTYDPGGLVSAFTEMDLLNNGFLPHPDGGMTWVRKKDDLSDCAARTIKARARPYNE